MATTDGEKMTWEVGMIVNVRSRTWAGINRPGGHGRISVVHKDEESGDIVKVDVKYVLGGFDKKLDLDFVEPVIEKKAQASESRRSCRRRLPAETKEPQPTTRSEEVSSNTKRQVKLTFDTTKPNNKKQRISSNNENEANAAQSTSKKKGSKNLPGKKQTAKGKNGTAKRKPGVRRKLAEDEPKAPLRAAAATPDVPRNIFIPTAAEGSSSSNNNDSREDPMSELKSTPQPYLLSEAVRRRKTGLAPTNLQESLANSSHISGNRSLSNSRSSSYSATPVKNTRRADETKEPRSATHKRLSPTKLNSPANRSECGSASVRKATLHSEHDRAMNNASNFIQGVLGANSSPSSKAGEVNPESATASGPKIDEALLSQFFKALHELMELNDGIVSDSNLVEEINQSAQGSKQFSDAEVEELLVHLCDENKIMRCDGQIFTI